MLENIEESVQALETVSDPKTREHARHLAQGLMTFHKEALTKLIEQLKKSDRRLSVEELANEPIIEQLLLLHGLHPLALIDRVKKAIESVQSYAESHGGHVSFVGIDGTSLKIKLEGSCSGCPSSMLTMKQTIEKAVFEAAPEITEVEAA